MDKQCKECGIPEVYLFGMCSTCGLHDMEDDRECSRGHAFCSRH